MNPQVEQQLMEMQLQIDELKAFKRAWFSAAEVDPQVARTVTKIVGGITLNELNDVDTSGVTNGQVIKYNDSTEIWENANDIDT